MPPLRSEQARLELAVEQVTLERGLRVLAIRIPAVHRVVAQVLVHVGPRFETRETNGISHLLEHMLFRGTSRFPSAHALALAFECRGASLSAATAVDHGVLALSSPPETFPEVLPWLGEVVAAPLLNGLELERGIVREEILETLDDTGRLIDAASLVRAQCFQGHPLGWPITGALDQLERFHQDDLTAHHRAHYTAPATVIAVAGPLEPEAVVREVARCFGLLPQASLPTVAPPNGAPDPRFTYVHHASSQTALAVAFRAPGAHAATEPATELLLRLLDDGMSTRLYHRICDERGLCYDVYASYEAYRDSGLLELGAETGHDNALKVLQELLDALRALREDGPEPGELEKAQARHGWQLQDMLDDPGAVAEFYALGELSGVARNPQARLEELASVTRDQLRCAAEQTLRAEHLTVVAVGSLPRRTQDMMARMVQEFR